MATTGASERSLALRESVLEDVRSFVSNLRQLDPEEVRETSHLRNELDLDSLDLAALAVQLEETYGVALDDEQMVTIGTVGDAVALVVELVDAGPVDAVQARRG